MGGVVSSASWMEQLLPVIGDKPFHDIAIPGAHDAGTYAITGESEVNDAFRRHGLPGAVPNRVIEKWARTQERSLATQLNDGVRFLDLRVCARAAADDLWISRSMHSMPLADALQQIRDFVDAHPKEIVILQFGTGKEIPIAESTGHLIDAIRSVLGRGGTDIFIKSPKAGGSRSFTPISVLPARILVSFAGFPAIGGTEGFWAGHPWIWPGYDFDVHCLFDPPPSDLSDVGLHLFGNAMDSSYAKHRETIEDLRYASALHAFQVNAYHRYDVANIAIGHNMGLEWTQPYCNNSAANSFWRPSVIFPTDHTVIGLTVWSRVGYGIVDAALEFKDRDGVQQTSPRGTNNAGGRDRRTQADIRDVLVGVQVREQSRYGITDLQPLYRERVGRWAVGNADSVSWVYDNNVPAGCEVCGMQVKERPGYGIVDIRFAFRRS